MSNQPEEKKYSVGSALKIIDRRVIFFEKEVLSGNSSELVYTQFLTTLKLSIYLVAFAMGELEKIFSGTKNPVISVYATDNIEYGKYALEAAAKCIKIFSDYFAISYPLEKIDMLAVPEFCMEAMENWGLITYRQSCMLYDSKNLTNLYTAKFRRSSLSRASISVVGNLVTINWWDDLWLNEGLATWASFTAMAGLKLFDKDV